MMRGSLAAFVLNLDRRERAVASILRLPQLVGGDGPGGGSFVLVLASYGYASLAPCLAGLRDAGVRLPFVTELRLQGLTLDALVPSGLGAQLPNLRQLAVCQCRLAPAAGTTALDAAGARIEAVSVQRLTAMGKKQQGAAAVTAQLTQLLRLPNLTSISLDVGSACPRLFIPELGTQLTSVHLGPSYRQLLPGTQTPAPAWRAALQRVARCTWLRELGVPCSTAQELRLLAPALQRLRRLSLTNNATDSVATEADGDAMLRLLLGLPHLTSLQWDNSLHAFRRWYAGPQRYPTWRWEQLSLGSVEPRDLLHLPLHSLKNPVQWTRLMVEADTPLWELQAAVANVTRCPAGFSWTRRGDAWPTLCVAPGADAASASLALQPLLASLGPDLEVAGVAWDGRLVRVLSQVLPRTCTRLALYAPNLQPLALTGMVTSLPWLRYLRLDALDSLWPADLVEELAAAFGRARMAGARLQLEQVVVVRPVRPARKSVVAHRSAWGWAAESVESWRLGVALMLEW